MSSKVRFAFAGDRDIAVHVLEYLLEAGHQPLALMLSATRRAINSDQLVAMCPFLPAERVFRGRRFRQEPALEMLNGLELDFMVCIHFPYIVPREVLDLPKQGVLNLHPAYLPFNRGWHTPSWAILDDTPIGATLHFMDDMIDTGDIVHQQSLEIDPADTADSLYRRLKVLELEVFKTAWPSLSAGTYTRSEQNPSAGTSHLRKDLFRDEVQRIDLAAATPPLELIRRLRALTTNDLDEAAYYEQAGQRYRVQVRIEKED